MLLDRQRGFNHFFFANRKIFAPPFRKAASARTRRTTRRPHTVGARRLARQVANSILCHRLARRTAKELTAPIDCFALNLRNESVVKLNWAKCAKNSGRCLSLLLSI